MLTLEPVSYTDPLDLLRRFAPTPLRAGIHLGFANVVLETNDLSFLPLLLHTNDTKISSTPCLWKIVRDVDVRGKIVEASILTAGNLIVYCMGPACLIGADRERREILAFIGRDVDALCFQESVLPALRRLTEFVTRPQDPAAPPQAEGPAGGTRHA
jgi:hypothetical protein